MNTFRYHLIDKEGKIRIGYMQNSSADNVQTLLQQAGILKLISIKPSALQEADFVKRQLFYFESFTEGKTLLGTIEDLSQEAAITTLEKDFRLEPTIVSANPNYQQQREAAISTTSEAKHHTTSSSSEPREEEHLSVLDVSFNKVLTSIETLTKDVLLDKQYTDEVHEMHEIITIVRRKEQTSSEEKFKTLRFLLRGLSFIADGMEPSPTKRKLEQLSEDTIALLQQFESLGSQSAFGLSTEATNISFIHPLEENELSQDERDYLLKKEQVTGLQNEIEAMMHEAEQSSGMAPDISLKTILLKEIPALLDWLILFFLSVVLVSQVIALSFSSMPIFGVDIAKLLQTFATSPLYIKTVLFLILLYTLVQIVRKQAKHSGVILLSLFTMILLMYWLFYMV